MSATLARPFPLLLAALLAGAAWLRFADLSADPPKGLSWSQGLYTDGAVVVQNARNQVLWGKPVLDYGIDMYWFPLSYGSTLAAFSASGVSSAAARGSSALLGLIAIACVALALRAEGEPARALAGAALLAVSFPFTMYNRIPLAEPAMIALMALALVFFSIGSARGDRRMLGASGFFAVAAPLFGKAHAAPLPIVGLLALVLGAPHERSRPRLLAYLGGCVAAVLAWGALLAAPHGREIVDHFLHESVVKHEASPGGGSFLREALSNALSMGARSAYLSRDFVAVTLALIALPLLVARRGASGQVESPAVRFAALWVLLGWGFIACVKFPAPRYLSALFIPMAVLAAEMLFPLARKGVPQSGGTKAPPSAEASKRGAKGERRGRAGGSSPRGERRSLDVWTLGGVLALALFAFAATLAHVGALSVPVPALAGIASLVPSDRDAGYPWSLLPIAALAAAGGTGLLAFRGARVPAIPRPLAVALVAVSLLLGLAQYLSWFPRRTHDIVNAGREIGRLLGPEAHLVGAYAPAVCLDNRLRVSPYFGPEYMGPDHDPDLFAHYGITHVVLVGQGDYRTLQERYPEIASHLTLVAAFPFDSLYSKQILLLRVPNEIGGRRIHDYEPTATERASEQETGRRAALAPGGRS